MFFLNSDPTNFLIDLVCYVIHQAANLGAALPVKSSVNSMIIFERLISLYVSAKEEIYS